MPLPFVFVVKGAFVVGKILLTKAGAAKTAATLSKSAVAKYGAAKATAGVVTILGCVGGVAWTLENFQRAQRAYEHMSTGDLAEAAVEVKDIAVSIKMVGKSDYAKDLQAWLSNGKPLDGSLVKLVTDGKALADEAMASSELV